MEGVFSISMVERTIKLVSYRQTAEWSFANIFFGSHLIISEVGTEIEEVYFKRA